MNSTPSTASRRTENRWRRSVRTHGLGADAGDQRPVRQPLVEVGLRLDDPDVRTLPPQPRRAVEGADDDRDDEHDEPDAEPGRGEDVEQAQAVERVDDARAERRVVDLVELVHPGRVVGRRAEREVGQLLDRHPDDREQGQDDDLDDGEVDRGEQAPDAVGNPLRGAWRLAGRPATIVGATGGGRGVVAGRGVGAAHPRQAGRGSAPGQQSARGPPRPRGRRRSAAAPR